MSAVIAAVRPGEVNLPLFLHVFGAMLLVGTLFTVAAAVMLDWGRASPSLALTRFGLWTVPLGVLPAYIVMRVGAEWTAARMNIPGDPTWIAIGYITADAGAVLILVSIVLAVIGLRKLRGGGGRSVGRAAGVISVLLVAAYLVAVWAMTVKPD